MVESYVGRCVYNNVIVFHTRLFVCVHYKRHRFHCYLFQLNNTLKVVEKKRKNNPNPTFIKTHSISANIIVRFRSSVERPVFFSGTNVSIRYIGLKHDTYTHIYISYQLYIVRNRIK